VILGFLLKFFVDDGSLYTFGSDYYGCLGINQEEGDEASSPVLVDSLQGMQVMQIACGDAHIVVLTRDSQAFSWGSGEFGERVTDCLLCLVVTYWPAAGSFYGVQVDGGALACRTASENQQLLCPASISPSCMCHASLADDRHHTADCPAVFLFHYFLYELAVLA